MKISNKLIKKLIRESIEQNLINEQVSYPEVPDDHSPGDYMSSAFTPKSKQAYTKEEANELLIDTAKKSLRTLKILGTALFPEVAGSIAIAQITWGSILICIAYADNPVDDERLEDGIQEIVNAIVDFGFTKAVAGPIVKNYAKAAFENPGSRKIGIKIGNAVARFLKGLFLAIVSDVVHQMKTGEHGKEFETKVEKISKISESIQEIPLKEIALKINNAILSKETINQIKKLNKQVSNTSAGGFTIFDYIKILK